MSSMDGAVARRPGKPDRKIYIGWITIVWLAIISGFGLDFGRYMAEQPGPPAILHIHATVYVVWLVLVSVQIFLVETGDPRHPYVAHTPTMRVPMAIDRTTVFWNLGLLCVVAFIPFATSVLGAYPIARPATVLYGLTLTSSAICYNLMLRHLMVRHAFRDDVLTSVRATARAAGGDAQVSEQQAVQITALRKLTNPRYAKPAGR